MPGAGECRFDPLTGHLVRDREAEHAVVEIERPNAGQPGPIGGIAKLVALFAD